MRPPTGKAGPPTEPVPRVAPSELLEVAAALAGRPLDSLQGLVEALDVRPQARGASSLNADGLPLQLCLSAGTRRRRVRLLVDPAHDERDPLQRLRRGLTALTRLADHGFDRRLCRVLLEDLRPWLPPTEMLAKELPGGALWIGLELGRAGRRAEDLAVYTSTRWGPDAARWRRLQGLLRTQGRAAGRRWHALVRGGAPASMGFEGRSPEKRRAKLYLRLLRPSSLSALGIPELLDGRMRLFLERVMGERGVPPSGLVLSVDLRPSRGPLQGAKLDLCGHCLARHPTQWLELLASLERDLGLAPLGVTHAHLRRGLEPAFIGLGINAVGAARLNLYLKSGPGSPC